MPRATLTRSAHEAVTLLTPQHGAEDDLGEVSVTWAAGETVMALVQPVTREQAARAGLSVDVERVRAYLPPVTVTLPARVTLRGQEWRVVNAEARASRTVVTLEEATQ